MCIILFYFGGHPVQSGIGVKIGDGIIPGLFFADNMDLFAKSKKELQKLLNIVVKFAKKWRIKFSGNKSKILHL